MSNARVGYKGSRTLRPRATRSGFSLRDPARTASVHLPISWRPERVPPPPWPGVDRSSRALLARGSTGGSPRRRLTWRPASFADPACPAARFALRIGMGSRLVPTDSLGPMTVTADGALHMRRVQRPGRSAARCGPFPSMEREIASPALLSTFLPCAARCDLGRPPYTPPRMSRS